MVVCLTVVAGVVGALVLLETVLPQAFAALGKWRKERAKEVREEAEKETTAAGGVVPNAPQPVSNADALGDGCGGLRTLRPANDMPNAGCQPPSEAQWLWEEARGMAHNFMPDWEKDRDYLSKIYTAAKLGHLEAMVKLGEYAYRRGALVEAYYWTLLAELKGAAGLDVALRKMRSRWLSEGCPAEYRNAYMDFTEEQGVFARAVLRLQCGVDPQYARIRLKELAERGFEDARAFLEVAGQSKCNYR